MGMTGIYGDVQYDEDEVAVPVAVLGVAQVSALFLLLILLREK